MFSEKSGVSSFKGRRRDRDYNSDNAIYEVGLPWPNMGQTMGSTSFVTFTIYKILSDRKRLSASVTFCANLGNRCEC